MHAMTRRAYKPSLLLRYDPVSAHFILTNNEDDQVVATVRLTPYPRTSSRSAHHHDSQPGSQDNTIAQNDTAMATSGGGPGGTSGGLAMTTSATSNPSPHTNQPPPKSDMEYHTGLPNEVMPKGRISDADIEEKLRKNNHGYPLGGPQSESSLAHEFLRKLKSSEPFKEIDGAPNARGAKLSRLAVSKTMRGKRLGARTVKEAEAWLLRILGEGGGDRQGAMGQGGEKIGQKEEDGSVQSLTIIISSQMHAKGFYEILNYTVYGEPYDEEGAPHTWCTKRIVYEKKS